MDLSVAAGEHCSNLLDEKMRGLQSKFIQFDEIWTFCFKKQKHCRKDDPAEFGDQSQCSAQSAYDSWLKGAE